jgi:hypothetical protein
VIRVLRWPIVVGTSTLAVVVMVAAGLRFPLAPLLAAWFVFVCPGMPIVRLLRLGEPLSVWVFAIAVSLSIEAVVSVPLLMQSAWTVEGMTLVVATFTMTGVGFDAWMTVAEHRREQGNPRGRLPGLV